MALRRELQAIFETRTTAEWIAFGVEVNTPITPVNDGRSILDDPQFQARFPWSRDVPDGADLMPLPAKLDGGEPPFARRAPTLGEHTEEILHRCSATTTTGSGRCGQPERSANGHVLAVGAGQRGRRHPRTGGPASSACRHWIDIRGPSWLRGWYGTECSQPAWQAPPMTIRSPDAGARSIGVTRVSLRSLPVGWRPLARGRRSHGLVAPRLRMAIDGVIEPAHVGIAVESLTVVAVSVLQQAESVELHVVPTLQAAMNAGNGWVRQRPARSPE